VSLKTKAEAARENGKRGGRPRGSKSVTTLIKERGRARALKRAETFVELSATRVLTELRRLAMSDIRQLFDEQGNLRPIHTLTADQAACIAAVEVVIKNAKAGDGVTDTIYKIKLWDKPRTLEMLAKHFGLMTERVEHSGGLTIQHEVPE